MHELIWTQGPERYTKMKHNMGSYNGRFQTNYWDTLHPLFEAYPEKRFFIIAGDIGGHPRADPAFYEEKGNVAFIASGMGHGRDENYLKVYVSETKVTFDLIPLNFFNTLRSLKHYSL